MESVDIYKDMKICYDYFKKRRKKSIYYIPFVKIFKMKFQIVAPNYIAI